MARARGKNEDEPNTAKVSENDSEKVGVTLRGYDLYRFRIFCATKSLRPSMMVQQLISERLRGFKLPPGSVYTPKKRLSSTETSSAECEDGEAA